MRNFEKIALNDNFLGINDDASYSKLQQLESLTENFPDQELFGTYDNDAHYNQVLNFFMPMTTETKKRGMFFLKVILPLLNDKNTFLDIGPGDGRLTGWIGNKFKHITVVDKNSVILDNLNVEKRIIRKHISLEKIYDDVLDANISLNYYNLALLSHILYYVDQAKWMDIIEKIYKTVKINGILVIVLNGGQSDKTKLIKHFGGPPINIDFLVERCINRFGFNNIKVYTSNNIIRTIHMISMLHIAGFFLYDVNTVATKKELINYIDKFLYKENNFFEMYTKQKFIVIFK